MLQTLSVLLQTDDLSQIDAFEAIVNKLRQKVQTHPVQIELRQDRHKQFAVFRFVSWSLEEYNAETIDIARAFVSLAVVEWIVRVLEPEILGKYLREDASHKADEWNKIWPYVSRVLHGPIAEEESAIDNSLMRKARLYRTVFSYLEENRELCLHGFVSFRLKEYRQELRETVHAATNEYLEDKQYQEFIELLRCLIDTQETWLEVVHIVSDHEMHFQLYDESGQLIPAEQLEAICGMTEVESNNRTDDYLISALITLAPKKVVFHHADGRQALVQTIKTIFESRFSYCSSCPYCLLNGATLDLTNQLDYNTKNMMNHTLR